MSDTPGERRLTTEQALRHCVESCGFKIIEGEFLLRDGSISPLMIVPIDPRRLLQQAMLCLDP